MGEAKMWCSQCNTHWSDCDVLADGKCASCLRAENGRLRGVCNLLANKLSSYTGYPIPMEIREAEAAEAAGAEKWDVEWDVYVGEDGNEAVGGE